MTPTGGGGAWPNNKPIHRATSATWHHWCGGRRRDLPRCRWAVAGPGRTTHRHPDRLEAAARPAGPGRASRRRAEPKARGTDGSRAGRRPRAHQAARPKHTSSARNTRGTTSTHAHAPTPSRHNKTARPLWGRAAVAVALGFEPRVAVTPHSISSAAPSAARTRYLTRILYYTLPLRAQIDRAGWEQGHIAVWEQGPARSHNSTRNRRHLTI